jgi:ribosomal protein S18 acetylase RimI-like enzyme
MNVSRRDLLRGAAATLPTGTSSLAWAPALAASTRREDTVTSPTPGGGGLARAAVARPSMAVTPPVAERGRTPDVGLRPAVPSDGDLLYGVFVSTREPEMEVLAWPRASKDALLRMQFDAQGWHFRHAHPNLEVSVVLVAGQPAGRLCVSRDGDAVHLLDIALLPEHRGRGVGTVLVTRLQAQAGAARLPLRLHVARTNPAARLYQRLGFIPAGGDAVHQAMEWTAVTAEAAG